MGSIGGALGGRDRHGDDRGRRGRRLVADLGTFVFFAVLVIVLSVRPPGLFGRPVRERSDAGAGSWSWALRPRWSSSPSFPLVVTNPSLVAIAVFTLLFMACATSWNMFRGLQRLHRALPRGLVRDRRVHDGHTGVQRLALPAGA